MPHDPGHFIGAWALADWRIEYAGGGVTRPFGDGAHGYIVYATNGIMTASIARSARPPFGIANARGAAAALKADAFDSYFHYAGSWRVEGEDIVHSVTMALNPDFTGTEQRRRAVFDGDDALTLSAHEPTADGGHRHHILAWRRYTV